jgi:hypothetical protein
MATRTLYEEDFYAWAMQNAALLKARRFDDLDFEHVAEELESMGKSEGRELNNRLKDLLLHLLKWEYQPGRQSRSWLNSINKQRIGIDEVLDESPSLTYELEQRLHSSYQYARRYAAAETRLPLQAFPEQCPYCLQDVLNTDFLPPGNQAA